MKEALLLVALVSVFVFIKVREEFDLSAGFVDLATYGEIDKYLYG
jgi:hypothetical protein